MPPAVELVWLPCPATSRGAPGNSYQAGGLPEALKEASKARAPMTLLLQPVAGSKPGAPMQAPLQPEGGGP